jgi:hypothetical protein
MPAVLSGELAIGWLFAKNFHLLVLRRKRC